MLEALSSPRLAIEAEDGWILEMRRNRSYLASTMRRHVWTLTNFITFLRAEAPALGITLEDWTTRMDVSISKERELSDNFSVNRVLTHVANICSA